MTCEYCNQNCSYLQTVKGIELLIELVIPKATEYQRLIDIFIIDWHTHIIIFEEEILVGEIMLNNWKQPQKDYEVKNYFSTGELPYELDDYILNLHQEIKMYYESSEFTDGDHPLKIKITIH